MERDKFHVGISIASIFSGVGMLMVTMTKADFSPTYKFIILGFLTIILVANLSSYLTSFFCLKRWLDKRKVIHIVVYATINIMFILLFMAFLLLIYLAF